MKSANKVVSLTREATRRDREELAFLPAALEIVETPPSPTGRITAGVIITLFCVALVWACLGHIDIIASAQGKIIPTGHSKLVQPLETGVVRAIHVRDGQSVKAGEILVELDPTINNAETDRLKKDLTATQLDVTRLRAALAEGADPLVDFHPPQTASAEIVAAHRRLLLEQVSEHRAKLAVIDRQRAQKSAELATVTASIEKLEALMPMIQDRFDIRKEQLERQVGSKIAYLENRQQLVDSQQEHSVQQSRYRETEAALATLLETRAQTEAEYHRTLAGELTEAERKVAGLSEDLVKAEQRTKLQQLTAPVDGVVQQLAVHTEGGVVTPAQTLMVVVPTGSRLEIEAMISNRDIGFVHPGQPVEIKVDTFNFTRYGLLHGEVLSLSRDAIVHDKAQDRAADPSQRTETNSSEPDGQQLLYSARISLDRTSMPVEEGTVDLAPGMAVTAEIKSGSRTIVGYLLSPLLRYGHDSMRER